MGGQILARGTIEEVKGEDRAGHWHVLTRIKPEGLKGRFEVVVKNEYMMAMSDGEPVVMFPDLICLHYPDRPWCYEFKLEGRSGCRSHSCSSS